MANEFIARKGLISLSDTQLTGSLLVSASQGSGKDLYVSGSAASPRVGIGLTDPAEALAVVGDISASGDLHATNIELGHASDTTIARSSAGVVTVEGAVVRTGTVAVSTGGTGATSLTQNGVLIGNGTSAVTAVDLSTDGVIVIGDGSGNPTTLDVGGSGGITILGTIATGVWQGTAIASAYLDADTAHLTTAQTFSGAKTFSAVTTLNSNLNFSGATSSYPRLSRSGTAIQVELADASDWGNLKTGGLTTYGASIFNENSADVDFRVESNDNANMFTIDGGDNTVGIGVAPKAVLHVKNTGNNWEDGILLQHHTGDTGWNIHPEDDGDNALWFGYNADTTAALTSQTATARMVLHGDGRVGIGDTGPQDWLEVRGASAIGGITISHPNHDQAALSFARSAAATARIFTTEPGATHTSAMHFQTGIASGPALVTAMTISETQKVGIGVTDPDSMLEIKGDTGGAELGFKTTDSSGNSVFWAENGGTVGVHYYPFLVNYDHDDSAPGSAIFHAKGTSGGAASGLFVLNTGKVGIGDLTPEEMLTIVAPSGDCNLRMEGDAIRLKKSGTDWLSYDGASVKALTGGVERIRITSTGVGIGHTADQKLSVEGHIQIRSGNWLLLRNNANDNYSYIQNADSGSEIQFATSGVKMVLTSAGLIGLGTTSPASALHIKNWQNADTKLVIDNQLGTGTRSAAGAVLSLAAEAGSYDPKIIFVLGGGGADWAMGVDNDNADAFVIAGGTDTTPALETNPRLTIDTSGNMVVGGTITANGSVIGTTINNASNDRVFTSTGSALNAEQYLVFNSSYQLGVGTDSPDSTVHMYKSSGDPQLHIQAVTGGDPTIKLTSANNRDGIFKFLDGSTTAQFHYDHGTTSFHLRAHNASDDDLYVSETATYIRGNTGIGITSPDGTLHVHEGSAGSVSAVAGSNLIVESDGNNYIQMLNPDGNNSGIIFGEADDNDRASIKVDGGSDDMTFTTGGSPRMTIDTSTARVGIGTTAPDSPLHIMEASAGSVAAYASTTLTLESDDANNFLSMLSPSGNNQGILFGDAAANYRGQVQYNHNGDVMIFHTAAAEKMRIASDGKVGIGTTSPSDALTVLSDGIDQHGGTIMYSVLRVGKANGTKGGWIGYDNDEVMMSFGSNGGTSGINWITHNGSSWGERMRIHTDGKVGIGNISPSSYYTTDLVVGTAGSQAGMTIVTSTTGQGRLDFADGTSGAARYAGGINYTHDGDYMRFGVNGGSEKMRIASDGKVGIGTTSASEVLQVEGNIRGNRLIMPSNGDGTRWILLDQTNTGESSLFMQAGGGSAGYGGGINLYGHSHDSLPGWVKAGISSSSGGKFAVNTHGTGGGTDVFTVDESGNVVTTGGAIFNEGSGDFDFRVESDDNANMFFIDGGDDKVGIGTASPAANVLEVAGPARSTAFDAAVGATWHDMIITNTNRTDNSAVGIFFQANGYHSNAGTGIAAVVGSGDMSAHLAFITRGDSIVASEKMRITDTGNVGIGTTNPIEDFVVSKAGAEGIEIAPAGVTADHSLIRAYSRNSSTYDTLRIDFDKLGLAPNGGIAVQVGTGSGNGNVGIGTTSPSRLLELKAGEPVLLWNATSTAASWGMIAGDGKFYMRQMTGNYGFAQTFVSGSGIGNHMAVGVGTTTPVSTCVLTVTGTDNRAAFTPVGSHSMVVTEDSVTSRANWQIYVEGSADSGIVFGEDGSARGHVGYDAGFGAVVLGDHANSTRFAAATIADSASIYIDDNEAFRVTKGVSSGGIYADNATGPHRVEVNTSAFHEAQEGHHITGSAMTIVGNSATDWAQGVSDLFLMTPSNDTGKGFQLGFGGGTLTAGATEKYGMIRSEIVYRGNGAPQGDLIFSTYGSGAEQEGFRIDHTGKVGFGVTAPSYKIHCTQTVGLSAIMINTSIGDGNSGGEMMWGGAGRTYYGGYIRNRGGTNSGDLRFYAGTSAVGAGETPIRMEIKGDGEVDVAQRLTVGHNNTVTSVSGGDNDALISVGATFVGVSAQTNKLNGLYVNNGFTTGAAIGNINQVGINTPGITETGGACTTASSLYIEGAPSAGTNNYAIYSDGGNNRFDGSCYFGGDTAQRDHGQASYPVTVNYTGTSNQGAAWYDHTTDTSSRYAIWFRRYYNSSWATVGSISTANSSTAYNTSSDYRMKENVVTLTGATARLKQLKPYRFNFKEQWGPADEVKDGFLAHEVAEVVPQAVHGEKDGVDEDGNPDMQGVDTSHLVPLLVATIQELEERITALEAGS